jgi:hypothetical protein
MNTYPGEMNTEMKASDADRDAVLSELSEHFQAGRLTAAEFDERTTQALTARTWGELRALLEDLPTAQRGPQAPAAASSAAASSAAAPERSSGRPAVLPAAALVGIGVAVALTVGVAHHVWGFWWLLLVVLFVARRGIRCAGRSSV